MAYFITFYSMHFIVNMQCRTLKATHIMLYITFSPVDRYKKYPWVSNKTSKTADENTLCSGRRYWNKP